MQERLDGVDWSGGVEAALRRQPREVQQFITNELLLCPLDFRYWAERYAIISHDAGRLTPFRFRQSQRKLLDKFAELEEGSFPLKPGKVAVIVVKARRVGATAIGQAMAAHGYLLRPQAKALVGSDTPKGTLELNHVQNRLYENLPAWMMPRMDGKVKGEHLRFPVLDSELTYTFGDAKTPIQGVRQDFVHLTEVPTWLYINTISEDIMPAFLSSNVPTSFMLLEGTGKSEIGSGVIYQRMYEQASAGKGIFRPLFLSWYDVPEIHSAPATGVEFTATTRAVAERIKRDTGYDCTREQLAWYQITRQQFEAERRLQVMLQEYPTSAEEAFQTGFNSAISLETRDRIRQEAKKPELVLKWHDTRKTFEDVTATWTMAQAAGETPSPLQHAFIFEVPKKGRTYVVGVDGSHGDPEYDPEDWLEGERDPSAVEVMATAAPGLPPEQVASWVGYIHPEDLALIAEKFGKMYSDATNDDYPAMMACEVNAGSPSAITQMELIKKGYPHFYIWPKPNKVGGGYSTSIGWETTPKSRAWITSGLVRDIEDGTLKVNSIVTIEQMKTFVRLRTQMGQVRLDHAPGFHDDSLFALGIALYCSQDNMAVAMARDAHQASQKGPEAPKAPNPQAVGMVFQDGQWQVVTPEWAGQQVPDLFN